MRHDYRDRTDRILAAVEIPALGIWVGDAAEAGAGGRRQLQGVKAAKMPGSDQPDLKSVHLLSLYVA